MQPLSAFLGESAPPAASPIDFFPPLTPEERTSLTFFDELNFLLEFCPIHPSEVELRGGRFATLGIGAGKQFDAEHLPPEMRQAVQDGMADAWEASEELKTRIEMSDVTSGDVVGTREYLQNNYLYRMAAAVLGIYGNSREEAIYPTYWVDAEG